jgi:acetyl esterase/lipase
VTCTVYRPPATTESHDPVYVNFHGGGFVVRRPEQDDPGWRSYRREEDFSTYFRKRHGLPPHGASAETAAQVPAETSFTA